MNVAIEDIMPETADAMDEAVNGKWFPFSL